MAASTDTSPPSNEPTPFGHPMLKHFLFSPTNTNLNHGSFGTYPHPIRKTLHSIQDETELNPDHFLRFKNQSYLLTARREAASLLNAPVNECVFVQNATTGVNTVLRNLRFEKGDVVVFFATTYGACEKSVASLTETVEGLEARKVTYQLTEDGISHEDIVRRFKEVVRKCREEDGLKVRVALFDTVVSLPGVRFPFERLVEVCREEGVLSLVDAAHGVGQIRLDLKRLDADFFVSNTHKWLFTPRGSAVLHVPLRNQPLLRTTYPTSHGFEPSPPPRLLQTFSTTTSKHPYPPSPNPQSDFETLFELVATMDMTPYFCVPDALRFRREVCGGEERIYEYLKWVAKEGGDRGAEVLGTEVMGAGAGADTAGGGTEWRDCAFANLRLPIAVVYGGEGEGVEEQKNERQKKKPLVTIEDDKASLVARWIEERLVFEMGTFVSTFDHGGWLWCRVSGQVYVEVKDFEWLAKGLKGLCERAAKGEWESTA